MGRPRVLLISYDPVGGEMLGPAIRAYELARVLGRHADVTLASPEPRKDPPADVDLVTYSYRDPRRLRSLIADADAIVSRPPPAPLAAAMRRSRARLIFDLYDPEPFELLERVAESPSRWRRIELAFAQDRFSEALHLGHHFVCASERQRDMWLGAMNSERVIDPDAYQRDPTLRSVLDVVPFGIPDEPPEPSGPGPRVTLPGLGPDSEILLWNGGIWPWLDAPTAVEAVALLARSRPNAKLVFMGASRDGAAQAAARHARARAEELGLLGDSVLFNDSWVPYAERAGWLCGADCAITTHGDHLETRFAFRTRILDCLWARLPIVCTAGDELADRIEREDLGAAVPAGAADAVAAALESVLERGRESYADALGRAAEAYAWERASEPLVRYITADLTPQRTGRPAVRRLAPQARGAAYRALRGAANAVARLRP